MQWKILFELSREMFSADTAQIFVCGSSRDWSDKKGVWQCNNAESHECGPLSFQEPWKSIADCFYMKWWRRRLHCLSLFSYSTTTIMSEATWLHQLLTLLLLHTFLCHTCTDLQSPESFPNCWMLRCVFVSLLAVVSWSCLLLLHSRWLPTAHLAQSKSP